MLTSLDIGKKLKKLRTESSLSQTELATKLNIGQDKISRLEQGKMDFDCSLLADIAKLFNVSTDYLLGLTEAKTALNKDNAIALRISCDYTGLSEEIIEFFSFYHLKCKDKNFKQDFIDFIKFFIITVEDDYSFSIDISDLIKSTNTYKDALANIIEKIDFAHNISDSPVPIELEEIRSIKNIKKEINASKYTLSEYFKSVIDDFILSKEKKTDVYDLADLEFKFYKNIFSEDV